ncbi:MAG: carbamoyltransferase HypF [Gracilibacteraceae bacterium]|jgi:hydrogenase maturation protein HypF|nr:carbamoyltransferase HypF [Gracilibacteraceae bacterium]
MREKALRIDVRGVVQGVGFRPFVYRLAKGCGIRGWVRNTGAGALIHAEGENTAEFYRRLSSEPLPLADIQRLDASPAPLEGWADFRIIPSALAGRQDSLISPDAAICADCRRELRDAGDRRFHYPFINCVNCGPRYTIIRARPYDRARTTMDRFPMCPLCAREYADPADRRFHAQPAACPACGPRVWLEAAELGSDPGGETDRSPLGRAAAMLGEGAILAVKGLGGFHLVCDALNGAAAERLRRNKERDGKPLAVMARDLAAARRAALLTPAEAELLASPAAPIVVVRRREEFSLPAALAPGLDTVGLMLPYTPLHELLFIPGGPDFLVMTSANLSGRPLIYREAEARAELGGAADVFVFHDREIYHFCDDSVLRIIDGGPSFFRRARGYVPAPLPLPRPCPRPAAALGAEMKNAFCLASGESAFVSQYLGNMGEYENFRRLRQEYVSFQEVAGVKPEVVLHDAHPAYAATRWAPSLGLETRAVWHHEAHLAAVQGEYALPGPVGGLVCDGTGYGRDGNVWGFEFFRGTAGAWRRAGHMEYMPVPGEKSLAFPLRIAWAWTLKLLSGAADRNLREWTASRLPEGEAAVLAAQSAAGAGVYQTSSCGRLFDAVSALAGVCPRVTYEGQAAAELESAAWRWQERSETREAKQRLWREARAALRRRERSGADALGPWPEVANGELAYFDFRAAAEEEAVVFGLSGFWRRLCVLAAAGRDAGFISYIFHLSLAVGACAAVTALNEGDREFLVAGGVFQNKLLTETLAELAAASGLRLRYPRLLPPGDGGIAFGQIVTYCAEVD